MLTKQERAEIAERLNECSLVSIGTLYSAVFGKDVTDGITASRIFEIVNELRELGDNGD